MLPTVASSDVTNVHRLGILQRINYYLFLDILTCQDIKSHATFHSCVIAFE